MNTETIVIDGRKIDPIIFNIIDDDLDLFKEKAILQTDFNFRINTFLFNIDEEYHIFFSNNPTVLCVSSFYGSINIIRYLILNGCDPNIGDDLNRTPIFFAAVSDRFDIIEYLFSVGANLNIRDSRNNTFLHIATQFDSFNTLKFCSIYDDIINLSANGEKGDTPLHIACDKMNIRLVDFLCSAGANVNATNNLKFFFVLKLLLYILHQLDHALMLLKLLSCMVPISRLRIMVEYIIFLSSTLSLG